MHCLVTNHRFLLVFDLANWFGHNFIICLISHLLLSRLPKKLVIGGGTHIGRWYGDVPPSRPPFSGHISAPETHLFKPFIQIQRPHIQFLQNLTFQYQFLPILTRFLACFFLVCLITYGELSERVLGSLRSPQNNPTDDL